MIYDTHCHLDLMDNMSGIIKEMQNSDIMLVSFNNGVGRVTYMIATISECII